MENLETKSFAKTEPRRGTKKRLFLLVVLLLLTGIMLSTSTYAWFTANQNVSVSNIRVNVAAKNGIQISADGTTWKSIVQTTDFTGAARATTGLYPGAVNQIPDTLEPVSTVGTITNGKMEMFYGKVGTNLAGTDFILTAEKAGEKDYNVVAADTTENPNTGKYISFDMFLRVTTGTDVYLSSNSGITSADEADKGIKNASRIAFITLGNTASGSELSEIQALGATGTPTLLMWEPNFDAHTPAGVIAAHDTYGVTVTSTPGDAVNGTAVAYDGIKAVIPVHAETEEGEEDDGNPEILLGNANSTYKADPESLTGDYVDYFGPVTINKNTRAAWTGTSTATYENLFHLNAGVTKVRVYVWVEGQDVDCENTASGGNIAFNLQITTNNGTQQG